MGLSVHTKGAYSAMNAETRKQTLNQYLSTHTVDNFNVQECYRKVFSKQDNFDKKEMKSIGTLLKYLKDVASNNTDVSAPLLDRAIQECQFLNSIRAKRKADERQNNESFKNDYGIILGNKYLD